MNIKPLTRPQMRKIILSDRGSSRRIASELGIHPINVTNWLRNRMQSARIAEACHRRVLELTSSANTECA